MLRYIVERVSDGKFLELELPITVSSASRKLNGAGSFAGTLAPDIGGFRNSDGSLVIDPYATFIHEESDGVIRGTWLVTQSQLDGAQWAVEGAGFSAYFAGRPYEGEYRGVRVDPLAVARHVVEHAQSFANANIGVTLAGSSAVRVGTNSDDDVAARQADVTAAKVAVESAKEALAARRAEAKASPTPANKNAVTVAKALVDSRQAAKKTSEDRLSAAKEQQSEDGGAWKLLWWDTPDCLDAIQDAITEAGFEWVEWSGWDEGRTKVLKEIRAVPRVGLNRGSLGFVEGDNIIETVVVSDDASKYANKIIVNGAGEGRDSLRFTLPGKDSRRSKPVVIDAKHVTKKSVLERIARTELKQRMLRFRVDGVRVINHPNAQFGAFDVGDTILVDAEVGWAGRQRLLRRIEEIELLREDIAELWLGDA